MWGRSDDDTPDLPQREAGSTVSKEDQEKIRAKRNEIQDGYNRLWESDW